MFSDSVNELNKAPEKTYKGSFNVRVTPDLHRDAAAAAMHKNLSLNEFVKGAISYAVKHTEIIAPFA